MKTIFKTAWDILAIAAVIAISVYAADHWSPVMLATLAGGGLVLAATYLEVKKALFT